MSHDKLLVIGKIIGAHGIRGNLKVFPYAEDAHTFRSLKTIRLKNSQGKESTHTIKHLKRHHRVMLMQLEGVDDRIDAEDLIGYELLIESEQLPALEEDVYYWFDLIGLTVVSMNDEYLGKVESVIPTGANDVYVVRNQTNHPEAEILIPATVSVVKSIDLDQKIMIVDLPEGL